jgi:hypothetical protein
MPAQWTTPQNPTEVNVAKKLLATKRGLLPITQSIPIEQAQESSPNMRQALLASSTGVSEYFFRVCSKHKEKLSDDSQLHF